MVSNYTMKPPVTQFYSCRRTRLSDAPYSSDELSFDVSSYFFIENVSSSPSVEPSPLSDSSLEQLIRCSHCLCWPPDNYSSSIFTVNSFSEPTSYRDVILHPE
jgi:hypothetical protein